jgi:hypothetical protein
VKGCDSLRNDRAHAASDTAPHDLGPNHPYQFLCECANPECTFRITLPLSVYEDVRADAKQFVVLPLHLTPEVET